MSNQAMLERLFCDAFGFDECSISQRQAVRDAEFLAGYPPAVAIAGLLAGAKVPARAGVAVPEYVEEEAPEVESEVEAPAVEVEVEADAATTADEAPAELPEDVLITDSSIPTKWHDELTAAGLMTVSEVKAFADLTTISGIGPKGAEEIRAAIA